MRELQMKFVTNTATIRWMRILDLFELEPLCSTRALAKASSSTTRTIVTDITDMKSHFKDALHIDSSHKGYIFTVLNPAKYLAAKRALITDEILFHIVESIFQHEEMRSSEWAERYPISESTVLRYLRKVQPVLRDYHLQLDYNPITFIGDEMDIRKFFHDFYYESEITAHTIFPPIVIHDITVKAFSDCQRTNKQACSFGELNYYLYITLERYCGGHTVKLPKKISKLFSTKEDFKEFAEINQHIFDHYQQRLPQEEILYLFLLVWSRRSINDVTGEEVFCQKYNQWAEITQLASDFVATCIPETKNSSRDHILIESFFTVAKIKQLLSPLLNHNIVDVNLYAQRLFPESYQKCRNFLTENPLAVATWNKKSLSHLSASLTIYLESIKSLYWHTKKNVAFLFEGSYILCQYLKSKSMHYLHSSKNFFFPDSNELSPDYLMMNHIDLVVTNYTEYVSDYANDIDCLIFKTFPDKNDWNKLAKCLNPHMNA
ncbi:helix-turn-helix domain-containing protein [Enterococcus gallinarum]|uniref:helix-turn-helix domain-containing protein n=1 Tax=Enterococcus gallinarum TaxID=1353 RepID=UPI0034A19D06